MEGKVEGFLTTFLLVLASLIFYNLFVRDFTPSSIQNAIGV